MTGIAITKGCTKNVRSSMHTLHYEFYYKSSRYSGTVEFNKDKRGDICEGLQYIVEFDSTYPLYNRVLLDSIIVDSIR